MAPNPLLPDVVEMRTLIARMKADTESIQTYANGVRDEAREQLSKSREERDKALADLSAAARNGELGDDGKRLARRVEAGETSWSDVLHGRDPSPEAVAVRASASRSLDERLDELAEDDPSMARLLGRAPTRRADGEGDAGGRPT